MLYTVCPECSGWFEAMDFLVHCLLEHTDSEIAQAIRDELAYRAAVAR